MKCVEKDCEEKAGTPWTPYWCLKHDEERRTRITNQLENISKDLETK